MLNRFEQVWRSFSRFVVDSTRDELLLHHRATFLRLKFRNLPASREIISATQRACEIFRKVFWPANSTLPVNTFARVKKAGREDGREETIGGRKKRGIRLFTCKTTPEDTASYNSANVGSVVQAFVRACTRHGVGNKSRCPVYPRIFRVTWNYFASLAKVARAPLLR